MKGDKTYNAKRLLDYALWYYQRYFPSNARLYEKLQDKAVGKSVLEATWDKMQTILVEDSILEDRVKNLIEKKKNHYYIRSNLGQKKFPREKIDLFLKEYDDVYEDFSVYEAFFRQKITSLLSRNKSFYMASQKLVMDFSHFRDEIQGLGIDYLDEEESSCTYWQEEFEKKGLNEYEVKQKLYQKGFRT